MIVQIFWKNESFLEGLWVGFLSVVKRCESREVFMKSFHWCDEFLSTFLYDSEIPLNYFTILGLEIEFL